MLHTSDPTVSSIMVMRRVGTSSTCIPYPLVICLEEKTERVSAYVSKLSWLLRHSLEAQS